MGMEIVKKYKIQLIISKITTVMPKKHRDMATRTVYYSLNLRFCLILSLFGRQKAFSDS